MGRRECLNGRTISRRSPTVPAQSSLPPLCFRNRVATGYRARRTRCTERDARLLPLGGTGFPALLDPHLDRGGGTGAVDDGDARRPGAVGLIEGLALVRHRGHGD